MKDLNKVATFEMTPTEYKRFQREWLKGHVAMLRSECGMTLKDAKFRAEYDFENYIGQAGDEARDEHIMHMREIEMKTETTAEIVVSDDLQTEGKALAAAWKKRESKARRDFRNDIAVVTEDTVGGFDVRLGNLMLELRSDMAEGERISTKLIKAAGIASIPSQRRSEALRLVTQREAIDTFLKENGKKFVSLTALFAAMDKQAKLDEADSEAEGEGDSEAETSDPITLDMIVANFVTTVTANGFTVEEALDTVIAQLSGDQDAQGEAA